MDHKARQDFKQIWCNRSACSNDNDPCPKNFRKTEAVSQALVLISYEQLESNNRCMDRNCTTGHPNWQSMWSSYCTRLHQLYLAQYLAVLFKNWGDRYCIHCWLNPKLLRLLYC